MSGLGASILEEGIEQGIERGIEQGIEQGMKKEARKNAVEFFRAGVAYSTVEACIDSLDAAELTEIYEGVIHEKERNDIKPRHIRR